MKMKNRALETTYDSTYSGKKTIESPPSGRFNICFFVGFRPLSPANDKKLPSDNHIFRILDRGVVVVMTDRPKDLRERIDRWKRNQ